MIKSKELAAIEAGNITAVDLLNKYPATELVNDLMEIIQNKATVVSAKQPVIDRIVITQAQFDSMFRIKGLDAEGNPTKRGRKPKSSE